MVLGTSRSGAQQRRRGRAFALLAVAIAFLTAVPTPYFPHVLPAAALLPSRDLFLVRAGSTFKYTMYAGKPVAAESLYTGLTTYPYVYSSDMNAAVVALLNGYLKQESLTIGGVGGGFATCMDGNTSSLGGQSCFKALLAAAAPADCPAANVLCCPLFWRVESQNSRTTMNEVIPTTIFWNGQTSVNGFFSNFSDKYLENNANCSQPLYSAGTAISVAVDAYGEWRFVNLTTQYTLLETAVNVSAANSAELFGGNPQTAVLNTTTAAKPVYSPVTVYMSIGVCGGLLALLFLFLVIAAPCGVRRPAARVRADQLRTMDLIAQQRHSANAKALLADLSSESESESESENVLSNSRGTRARPSPPSTTASTGSKIRGSVSGTGASKSAPPPAASRKSHGSKNSSRHSVDPQRRSAANSRRASPDNCAADASSSHATGSVLGRHSASPQPPVSGSLLQPSPSMRNARPGSTETMAHTVRQPQQPVEVNAQQNNWVSF